MMRLNKYMAECGVGSRRTCDQMIMDGLVSVNDVIEKRLGTKIEEKRDEVKINGKLIKRPQKFEYIILNKPKGCVTTVSDEKKRKTVVDLVKSEIRIFPVGRLDVDTSGLLLFTNDGDLAYRLTHPKFEIDKVYEVLLDKNLAESDRKELASGIVLEEGKTSHCAVEFPNKKNKRLVRLTIHQGWKRQIRRMFAALNYRVVELRRIGFGCLKLNGLALGAWRVLTDEEVSQLKNIGGD
ncbi:MAG: pseudouridine synthase [bacterium]